MESEHKSHNPLYVDIGSDDCFEPAVEELVNIPKVAIEIYPRLHRRNLPRTHNVPNEVVLTVRAIFRHFKPMRVIATKGGGQWFIQLVTERGDMLRQYHHQYNSHTNPDGSTVSSSHKHFPTKKYPLYKSHHRIDTWAYEPESYPQDFIEAVKTFCKECK